MALNDDTTLPAPGLEGSSSTHPLIGEVVAGKYKVVGKIAIGGMATLYKAEQLPLGRAVALKVLVGRSEHERDPRFQKRFFLEAATCAKLKHPNTVTIHDYGQLAEEGEYYMVMEYVEGPTLLEAIRQAGGFSTARALHVGIEIARSLREAHEYGVVHRDLKSANVMLPETLEGESVKVLDFGIAKVMQREGEEVQNVTLEDRIVGSPRYMAPEQISNGVVDARADIYSLGIVMYEMLVGRPPFIADQVIGTLMMQVNERPRTVSAASRRADIPPSVDDIIARCLEKDPADRPVDVSDVGERLRACLADLPDTTGASNTESLIRRAVNTGNHSMPTIDVARPAMGPNRFAAPVVLALVTAVVVLGWLVTRQQSPQVEPPEPELAVEVITTEPAVLQLATVPAGAAVWEGNRNHGITPLQLPLDKTESIRDFELRLDGYEVLAISQGPSATDVLLTPHLVEVEVPPEPAAEPVPTKGKKKPADLRMRR